MNTLTVDQIQQGFRLAFPDNLNPEMVFFAPGRINLIGEHTDYNGGFVMPIALTLGTYLAAAPNACGEFRLYAGNFHSHYNHSLGKDPQAGNAGWQKYPMGLLEWFVQRHQWTDTGWDFYFIGDLPLSAGLSSSASVEMATATALNEIYKTGYSILDLVKASKEAENNFVGVNCGILDMFASGMGRKGHSLKINCDTLEMDITPFNIFPYRLVIMNTNVKRGLAHSRYNERVDECMRALKELQAEIPVNALGHIHEEQFLKHQHLLKDITLLQRARHVITENNRVDLAARALLNHDIPAFGKLMVSSHESLKHDYEVTGFHLDTLV